MKPEKVFRVGSVSASVFTNEVGEGDSKRTVRNVNLQRTYRTESGDWKSSSSFALTELAQLRMVVDQAIAHVAAVEMDATSE